MTVTKSKQCVLFISVPYAASVRQELPSAVIVPLSKALNIDSSGLC